MRFDTVRIARFFCILAFISVLLSKNMLLLNEPEGTFEF